MLLTPTWVILPPKLPNCSTSMVFAPSLAAEIAAASPAGPLPTTSTSVSAMTGIDLDGSWMNFISVTLAENLIYTRTLEILQILHLDN
jgi:hypothetical protein